VYFNCARKLLGGYWAASEGIFESGLKYLINYFEGKDDIYLVPWMQEYVEDRSLYLKKKPYFWKCSLDYNTENFSSNSKSQGLTRVDLDKKI